MKRDGEVNCSRCGEKKQKRICFRISRQWVCKFCQRERRLKKREKHLEELVKLGLLPKEKTPQEMMEEREKKKAEKVERDKNALPKIKSIKKEKIKLPSYLSFQEKKVLFNLLLARGFDWDECKERVKKISVNTKEIREKIKEKARNQEEAENNFKEEFRKMLDEIR